MITIFRWWFRLLGVFSPRLAGRMAADTFVKVRPIPVTAPGAAALLASAEFTHVASDRGDIAVYRWPRPGQPKILVLHGWSDSAGNMAPVISRLLAAGLDVTAADMPGHGRSSSGKSNMGEYIRAIRCLGRTYGRWHGIVAHSMGACCAALSTQAGIVIGGEPVETDRLVLLAPPNFVHDATKQFSAMMQLSPAVYDALEANLNSRVEQDYRVMNTADALAEFGGRAMIIHDTDDRRVPVGDFHAEQARAPQHDYVETSGLGHRRILTDDRIGERIVEFLVEQQSK